jgi:hypothetical protein
LTSNVVAQSKAGSLVALAEVSAAEDIQDNNLSVRDSACRLVLASKALDFEEDLVVEAEDSAGASVATEAVDLAIEADLETEADLATEVDLVVEVGSDIKAVEDLEAEVGMRTALLLRMHRVDQVVAAVGTEASPMVPVHLTMAIVAEMATVIGTAIVGAVLEEVRGMTAETHEALPEAIENRWLSPETEVTAEIGIATRTATESVTGMAAAAADEMMTMVRGNDTMKVMDMTTREAREGTKYSAVVSILPRSKKITVCRWVTTSSTFQLHLRTSRLSQYGRNGLLVGTYVLDRSDPSPHFSLVVQHNCQVSLMGCSHLRSLEFISSLLLA